MSIPNLQTNPEWKIRTIDELFILGSDTSNRFWAQTVNWWRQHDRVYFGVDFFFDHKTYTALFLEKKPRYKTCMKRRRRRRRRRRRMFVETKYDSTVRCYWQLQPPRELYVTRFAEPRFFFIQCRVSKKPVCQEYIKVRKQPGARRAAYPEPLGGRAASQPPTKSPW